MLFRFRFQQDDSKEKRAFIESLNLEWEPVGDEEKRKMAENLVSATLGLRRVDDETWYKVDWEKVPELVERRSVFVARGKAYVPGREQLSMIIAEFTARLERALEVCSSHTLMVGSRPLTVSLADESCPPPIGRRRPTDSDPESPVEELRKCRVGVFRK